MLKLSRRKLAEHATSRLLAGDSKKTVFKELAAYLLESGRRREAELVVRDIEVMLAKNGEVVATVTSARPLTDDAKAHVEAIVRQHYPSAKHISLRESVDESLIGGVKLELPDAHLDASVKAKLEKLTV